MKTKKLKVFSSILSALFIANIFTATSAFASDASRTSIAPPSTGGSSSYYIPNGGIMRYKNDKGMILNAGGGAVKLVVSPVVFLTPSQSKNYYYHYLSNRATTDTMPDLVTFLLGLGAPRIPVVGPYLAGALDIYAGIDLINKSGEAFTASQIKDCVDNGQGMEIYTEQIITGRGQGDGTFQIINPWKGPYSNNPATQDIPIQMTQLSSNSVPFTCDTHSTVSIYQNRKYTALITADEYPNVVAGTGGIVSIKLENHSGNKYYFSFTGIKKGRTGIYINSSKPATFICNVV